ncbi:MAG: Gfo/Idh/MocA family oxidoreductase [Victivallales bacterium]
MNIGFIGLGCYAQTHLSAIEQDAGFTLVRIYDVNAATLAGTCKRFNCRPASSIEELASDKRVEAVIISTPNQLHFEHFKICAEAGKHVLMNIPATTDPAEAEEIIRLAREKNIVFMPGHNTRRNPAVIAMKKALASESIGNPHLIGSMVSCPRGYNLNPEEWRYSKEKAPLLPFTQMGIVFIDMIMFFWGIPETVAAMMTKRDSLGEAPDSGMVICRFKDGKLAHVGCSYVCSDNYFITAFGRQGNITWDYRDNNSLIIKTRLKSSREIFVPVKEQHAELIELSDCIKNHKKPTVNAVDAYNLAEFYRCITESVGTGKEIEFREFRE